MRKSLILTLSILGGILTTLGLVSVMAVTAANLTASIWSQPQPFDEQQIEASGVTVAEMDAPLEYQTTLERAGVVPDLIPSITPLAIDRVGIPAPGEILTYFYTTTPASTDGEGVDAYMFVAPQGWDILAISAAPLANNGGCPSGVHQNFSNTPSQAVAYWGRADLLPVNPADIEPIAPEDRSGCGPWIADGAHAYTFWVRVQIPSDAVTCPGAPRRVGIPWDTQHVYTWKPERPESMTMYLYGDHAGSGGSSVTSWKIQLQQACPVPVVDLQNTVGMVGQCPSSSQTALQVVSGTQVEYCYKLFNLNTLVTLTYHSVADSLFGTYPVTYTLPGGSWTYVAIPQIVTGTKDTEIINTAVYTGKTTLGFGQSPQDDPTAAFTTTQYSDSDSAQASVTIIENYRMLFPIIVGNSPPPPRAGYWAGYSEEFYVTPGGGYVDQFSLFITIDGCGEFKITHADPIPIVNDQFAFSGSFSGEGEFLTHQTAQGVEGLKDYYLAPCNGYVSTPDDWEWSAFWTNVSQPVFQTVQFTPITDPWQARPDSPNIIVEQINR